MAFRKPGTKKIGTKFMVYGMTGSGKTIFGLSFPQIALLDTEAGAVHYEGTELAKNLQLVDNSQSFSNLEDTIDELSENYQDLGIKTFVIDSETKIQNNLQQAVLDIEEKRARRAGKDAMDANVSVRGWGRIKAVNSKLQNLKIDLSAKGVNVVSICQAKEVKRKIGEEFVVDHYSPEAAKNSEFDYDVVLFLHTDLNPKTGEITFAATVEKDRTRIFKVGQEIENPTFDLWEKHLNEKSTGKETLNSNFAKDIEVASEDYEEDVANEEASLKDRVYNLMAALKELDEEKHAKFVADFKALKIPGFEGITEKQTKKVEELLNQYND